MSRVHDLELDYIRECIMNYHEIDTLPSMWQSRLARRQMSIIYIKRHDDIDLHMMT